MAGWDFWIDRGGTFTDIVARDPEGRLHRAKLLSENPGSTPTPRCTGSAGFSASGPEAPIPAARVASVKMGTTVATNALLERKGEPVVLVTTHGLGQQLRLAYQNRPRLFDRQIVLPEMLYSRVIEADERVRADGTVERAARRGASRGGAGGGARRGARRLRHRLRARLPLPGARGAGGGAGRGGGLLPGLGQPPGEPADEDGEPRRHHGGRRLSDADPPALHRPGGGGLRGRHGRQAHVHAVLGRADRGAATSRARTRSSPGRRAAWSGAVRTSQIAGQERIIGFDMGGTSTDVCHFAGEFERVLHTEIAGVRITAPMMMIHTVAAGGGSILSFDGARMRVGPESAGADPGPASYGRGGPLAVTDANVVTGRLRPEFFPAIFGPGADRPLDAGAARAGFAEIAARIGRPAGGGRGGVPPDRRREHGERDQEDQRAARLRRLGLLPDGLRRARGRSTPAPSPTRWGWGPA